MKLNKDYVTHMVDSEQIMVATGKSINKFNGLARANSTAAFIIETLKNDCSEADVVAAVLSNYEVSEEKAKEDVTKIIAQLKTIGAIDD